VHAFLFYIKQTIFEDLKAALNLWQEIYEVDSIAEGALELQTSTIILILNVIDLSQLKVIFSF